MSGYPWRLGQIRMVTRLAGRMSLAEMATRISAVGPARSPIAVRKMAAKRGIDWRGGGDARRRDAWTDREDALLRSLAGRVSDGEMTDTLNAHFRTQRSVGAVKRRASTIGVSLVRDDGFGMETFRKIFAMDDARIRREVHHGRLRAEQQGSSRRGSLWLFRPADVEAWVRGYPYLLNWRRVRAGRWRDLARAASLGAPHLTVTEAAAHLGVDRKLVQGLIRRGEIDGVRDIGTPLKPIYRIPLDSLDQIAQLARKGAAA